MENTQHSETRAKAKGLLAQLESFEFQFLMKMAHPVLQMVLKGVKNLQDALKEMRLDESPNSNVFQGATEIFQTRGISIPAVRQRKVSRRADVNFAHPLQRRMQPNLSKATGDRRPTPHEAEPAPPRSHQQTSTGNKPSSSDVPHMQHSYQENQSPGSKHVHHPTKFINQGLVGSSQSQHFAASPRRAYEHVLQEFRSFMEENSLSQMAAQFQLIHQLQEQIAGNRRYTETAIASIRRQIQGKRGKRMATKGPADVQGSDKYSTQQWLQK
ncbi:hypothetical protein HPB49_009924 [Dermacentor silvarum]|uniref:Uncharacterized protein n=1 Tax=Dermacentor silvarum TaxID=543639 RepID=A0ACB8CEH8_DERSI|nr:hypothetical protein HPB49_009924 [Dermacentor silvarum]